MSIKRDVSYCIVPLFYGILRYYVNFQYVMVNNTGMCTRLRGV